VKDSGHDGKNTAIGTGVTRTRLGNHGSFPVKVSWLVEN
jgi:hypothetical protein